MRKALFAMFLMIAVVCLAFAGATKEKTSESTTTGNLANLNVPGEFPIVKQKVTLNVFVPQSPMLLGPMDVNPVTKYWEKLTNVHINWSMVPESDAGTKINLILSSQQNIPEVILMPLTNAQQIDYGSQGILLPLNDLIKKYGVMIKKLDDYDKSLLLGITAPNGKIYGMPDFNECYHCMFAQRMWINKKWIDKLGLTMPGTTDEFYSVLKAFKNKDPNGNGKQDEIPFIGMANEWHGSVDEFLMNPFILNYGDGTTRLYWDGDNLKCAAIQEQWREGLRYLRKLYSEGLIDREAFTLTSEQAKQLTENDLVGAAAAGYHGQFCNLNIEGAKLYFEPVAPLKGPTGLQQTPYFHQFRLATPKLFITKACKEPEVAFLWADALYHTYQPGYDESYGPEGVVWRKPMQGEVGLDGGPAVRVLLYQHGEASNDWWWGFGIHFFTNADRNALGVDPKEWNLEKHLYDATYNYYDGHQPKKVVLEDLFMEPAKMGQASELRTTIDNYITENVARFVTGALDIEKDWDRYLSEMKSMGIDRYTALIQEAYEKQYGQKGIIAPDRITPKK